MKIAIDTAGWPIEAALDLAAQTIAYHLAHPPQEPVKATDGRLGGRAVVRVMVIADDVIGVVFQPTTAGQPEPQQ